VIPKYLRHSKFQILIVLIFKSVVESIFKKLGFKVRFQLKKRFESILNAASCEVSYVLEIQNTVEN
jgi:hypothetical protein